MVIESSSATATTTLLLTSGASGRVNALLSWRALKSMFLLIKASLFFLLLFPFQLARTANTTTTTNNNNNNKRPSSSSSSSSSPTSTSSSSKNEKKHHHHHHLHHHIKNPFFLRRIPTPTPMVTVVPHLTSNNNNNNNAAATGAMVVVSGDSDVAARRALAISRATQDDDTCTRQVSLFLTSRGDTLFTQSWTPPLTLNIRGVVVLLHGLNEHSGRYGNFAKKLNANGYKVYGMDWIGHGGSDGLHAYVHSLDYAVNDMKAFIEKIVAENEGLPCFCFGHSTGAAIVLKSMLDQKIKVLVKGVVLTSPAVRVQPSHPIFGVLAPIFSFLLPTYQFRAANKNGTCVSRDPDALIAKYTDPLVYTGSIRVRTGYEILRISSYLQRHISRLTTPFLVLHGTCDAVTDPGASVELHEKAASTDKSIKLYNGLLHDLLFEPEREVVAKDIIDWLNSRV